MKTLPIELINICPQDLTDKEIRRLYRLTNGKGSFMNVSFSQALHDFLLKQQKSVFLAKVGNIIVGWALLDFTEYYYKKKKQYLLNIYTAKKYRNLRVGSQLIQFAAQILRERKVPFCVFLGARSFFKRNGLDYRIA